jgi:hypothetical protein
MKSKVVRSKVTPKKKSQNIKKVDSVNLKKKMEKKPSKGITLMEQKTRRKGKTSKEAKPIDVPELIIKAVVTEDTVLTPAQRRAKNQQ